MITAPIVADSPDLARRRARAALSVLAAVAVLLLAVIGLVAWFVLHGHLPAHHPDPGPDQVPSAAAPPDSGGWDLAAEKALATRPMLALPEVAEAPQPLAQRPATATLHLPVATGDIGDVPAGFPNTPEGAVAALAALTTQGMRDADPRTYSQAYQTVAAPGAPPADQARLTRLLTDIRTSAGLAPTGPKAGLTMSWQPEQAQIKGVLDGGRYVVACVLGQFTADYQGRLVTYGVGDCQALRWMTADPRSGATGQWLISPGPAAATAPDAWPGSQDSVNAGYLELR
jgi:hypothetical protein